MERLFRQKINIVIDPTLRHVGESRGVSEKFEAADRALKKLRMPDMYYEQMADKYQSQKLRDALKKNWSGKRLNKLVDQLAKNNPEDPRE